MGLQRHQVAIQIAHDAGATGAEHVIAMEEVDYVSRVNEINNGKGARVTFDPIGALLEQLAAASAPRGMIIEYGIMSGSRLLSRLPTL